MSPGRRHRLLLLLLLLAARPAAASCDLDTGHGTAWMLRRDDGIAWLANPCGERFFSLGVNVLDGGAPAREAKGKTWYSWTASAPSLDDWVAQTRNRLARWGFNSAGGWSLPPDRLRLPSIPDLELGRLARFHWFDPFDPAMPAAMDREAEALVQPYRGSPYRIGYFTDNEVGWWGGALFAFYGAKPAANATKQRWLDHLKAQYQGDWQRFIADFVPPEGVGDWAALLQAGMPTRLRPGGNGAAALRGWTRIVAERYYALAEHAIRTADPDALIFGDRLPIYYDPDAVRAEAAHVDAIATNYNVDSPEGWIAPYYFDGLNRLSGGKPVLVSEWFYAASENRSGNSNNGHLMTVATQSERGAGAAQAIREFARLPDLVGLHWFQYADNPRGGRDDGEDYDFGLVDIDDQPYEDLVERIAPALAAAPALHAAGPGEPGDPGHGDIAIPYAEIAGTARSLRDWPKPASLLPPLTPAPGEVAFGEAYLAWDQQGLALATIGQDYYDVGLLAYDGAFPLSEAYRVELGVDAGRGPRHFTIYFIPPRTKVKDHPPMTALLCTGTAAGPADGAATCMPVAGGRVSYFGADQPRITAEALIPWCAIGLDGPPLAAPMRVEVSATAWFRSRWMSLSGLPPEQGRARPGRWAVARLGRMS